jgi:hypothetical protein
VLYVDGEMAASELQERLRKFCGTNTLERLDILASETFYQGEGISLNLAALEHRVRFMMLLDALKLEGRDPRVIFLDNKSALSFGADENSNSEQDAFVGFLRELRHRGYTVLLVHHAGKDCNQRGASRTEDFLDLVIKLEAPKEANEDDRGAAFGISFTKHRGLRPDPATLDLRLIEDERGKFDWTIRKPTRTQNWLRVAEYIRDHAPRSQKEIGVALALDKSDVSEHIKKLRDRTMLEPDLLQLTHSGLQYLLAVNANRLGKNHDIEGA